MTAPSPTPADPNAWPLILLPGIGTNAQVFALQRAAFPQLIVPPWLVPERRERLPHYAERLAAKLAITGPCVVGGMSFGGLVAQELAGRLDARGCFLISSVRSRHDLARWMRRWGRLAWLLPPRTDRWASLCGWATLKTLGPVLPARSRQLLTHFSKTKSPILSWACQQTVSWEGPSRPLSCPVYQMHGTADAVFPLGRMQPDRLVEQGGHTLPLSHPFLVNAFLREGLDRIVVEAGLNPANSV